jgi:hypothetical protein
VTFVLMVGLPHVLPVVEEALGAPSVVLMKLRGELQDAWDAATADENQPTADSHA